MTGERGKSFSDLDWEGAQKSGRGVLLLRPIVMLQIRLGDIRPRRHAAGQPHVAADGRALADGDAPEDRRPGINHHVVLDDRMARMAFLQLPVFVRREALGAQGHGLVDAHPLADDRGFADHHTGPMVDEEARADLRAGVDIDTGGRVGDFRNDPRQQR